jgi:phosphoglycolate phosphatase
VSANHALKVVGLPTRPEKEIFGFIGEGAQRLIERTLGPDHADLVPKALEAWREHYELHMLDTTLPYPGVVEALARLTGPKAIVTNKPGDSARGLVRGLGLAQHCPVVVGGGDVPTRKPEPEGVRLALRKLGEPRRALLVGDSRVDAATARAAGIGFVGVLWGLGTREEIERAGGRILIERPEELEAACEQAFEEAA